MTFFPSGPPKLKNPNVIQEFCPSHVPAQTWQFSSPVSTSTVSGRFHKQPKVPKGLIHFSLAGSTSTLLDRLEKPKSICAKYWHLFLSNSFTPKRTCIYSHQLYLQQAWATRHCTVDAYSQNQQSISSRIGFPQPASSPQTVSPPQEESRSPTVITIAVSILLNWIRKILLYDLQLIIPQLQLKAF